MNKTPKLRFKEFSGEWESKKLGDIAIKVGSGKTPRGGNSVYTDSGVVFLRSQNVLNGKLNLNDVAYISEEINSTMKSTEVHGDDILLNITGASIGRSCKVPTHFPKANVNQHVCIIRLNENYNSSFIMNQIISSKVQRQIDSSCSFDMNNRLGNIIAVVSYCDITCRYGHRVAYYAGDRTCDQAL